jgi:hypothetical protein
MAERSLSRRAFIASLPPLLATVLDARRAGAQVEARRKAYAARVSLLFGLLRLDLAGTVAETIDRSAARYTVHIEGQGAGIADVIESSGTLRAGRWAPLRTHSRFVVQGRESRLDVEYDYGRGTIEFHSRQETFLLRRLRVTDDVLPLPEAEHVDDAVSAALNYAEGRWGPGANGLMTTRIVRRRRRVNEGPDDVDASYRAEIVPFVLTVASDPETGRPAAYVDLTRFSSWAREKEPARIVFGADRRPELISTSLILGTSVVIQMGTGPGSAPA